MLARFHQSEEGWHSIVAGSAVQGPFPTLRLAAAHVLDCLEASGGLGATSGMFLFCRPGDVAFAPGDIVGGRVVRR